MTIHRNLEQRSWEWFVARAGKITGSELGNLITDKGKIRSWDSQMPNSYLHRKLAEKWRGAPLESFGGNRQTDQGNIFEGQARAYFASVLETDITQVGGIESDDGRLWCSPDGLIGEREGLEIKCPNPDHHIAWLLDGQRIPEEHRLQVQFALFVTGWPRWHFLSYCKGLPHLAVIVESDEEWDALIGVAVEDFNARFDAAWIHLCELNGGPPANPQQPTNVKFSWEYQGDENDVPMP